MIPLSIGSATEVYGNVSRCEIIRQWVDHPGLADVSCSLRTLIQSLGDEATDEYWRQTIGPIRKLAFAFCSTPLPFDQATASTGIDWDKLHRQVRLCKNFFPDFHEGLGSLVQKLQSLSAETSSPFVGPLETLHRQTTGLSLLMRSNPRMNQAVTSYFARSANLRNARVVSALQLRGGHHCNVLAVIGPCGWFPEYVFSAPRAQVIHVLSFRWIRDPWKPGPIFLQGSSEGDGSSCNHRIGILPKLGGESTPIIRPPSEILPVDLLPRPPVVGHLGISNTGSQSKSSEETVPARLCLLSGNRAVFVAADEGATSLIIDTSEMGNAIVRRAPPDELDPGLSLLLRTAGGGDFIAPLADRILGASAAQRRTEQVEWKESLISRAVERFGYVGRRELSSRVSAELRSQDLCPARPANVHYWMSSKCIRPRKIEDFVAILTFAGFSERVPDLWAAMGEIDRAHRSAGHLIRRMLLEKIANTSLEPLERDGEMIFELGDQDGGTLSAFQITGILADEFDVPTDRIGVLLDMEE